MLFLQKTLYFVFQTHFSAGKGLENFLPVVNDGHVQRGVDVLVHVPEVHRQPSPVHDPHPLLVEVGVVVLGIVNPVPEHLQPLRQRLGARLRQPGYDEFHFKRMFV